MAGTIRGAVCLEHKFTIIGCQRYNKGSHEFCLGDVQRYDQEMYYQMLPQGWTRHNDCTQKNCH